VLTRKSIKGLSVIEIAILIVLALIILGLVQNFFDFTVEPQEPGPPEVSY